MYTTWCFCFYFPKSQLFIQVMRIYIYIYIYMYMYSLFPCRTSSIHVVNYVFLLMFERSRMSLWYWWFLLLFQSTHVERYIHTHTHVHLKTCVNVCLYDSLHLCFFFPPFFFCVCLLLVPLPHERVVRDFLFLSPLRDYVVVFFFFQQCTGCSFLFCFPKLLLQLSFFFFWRVHMVLWNESLALFFFFCICIGAGL